MKCILKKRKRKEYSRCFFSSTSGTFCIGNRGKGERRNPGFNKRKEKHCSPHSLQRNETVAAIKKPVRGPSLFVPIFRRSRSRKGRGAWGCESLKKGKGKERKGRTFPLFPFSSLLKSSNKKGKKRERKKVTKGGLLGRRGKREMIRRPSPIIIADSRTTRKEGGERKVGSQHN